MKAVRATLQAEADKGDATARDLTLEISTPDFVGLLLHLSDVLSACVRKPVSLFPTIHPQLANCRAAVEFCLLSSGYAKGESTVWRLYVRPEKQIDRAWNFRETS